MAARTEDRPRADRVPLRRDVTSESISSFLQTFAAIGRRREEGENSCRRRSGIAAWMRARAEAIFCEQNPLLFCRSTVFPHCRSSLRPAFGLPPSLSFVVLTFFPPRPYFASLPLSFCLSLSLSLSFCISVFGFSLRRSLRRAVSTAHGRYAARGTRRIISLITPGDLF